MALTVATNKKNPLGLGGPRGMIKARGSRDEATTIYHNPDKKTAFMRGRP